MKKIASAPRTYAIAINGTNFSVTDAILFSPPTITSAAIINSTIPVIYGGIEKAASMLAEMEFTWLILPIPKEASRQKMENRTKVHVDYGEPKYCSDEVSIDDAIKAAGSDAKTRLLNEFPEAEDIKVEASIGRELMITANAGRMNKVYAKAFAVGYIPMSKD